MPNLIGQSIGRYKILEELGRGGMAVVYKAYDTHLEIEVAIKFILIENLPQSGVERALLRFKREAKALAELTHTNIIPIIDYGEFEGRPYLVMKYLPGGTLKQRLNGKPMPWRDAVRLLIPVANALECAHSNGKIHRDVKSTNIIFTSTGVPVLTDFGIAKIIDDEATVELTGTGTTMGTPAYMAPEQVVSKNVDHRADIYSLGIVFYEMVTGRCPFEADTPMAVLFKHANEPLPRPRRFVPDLSVDVEKVISKALAKKPDDRYQSMSDFGSVLEQLMTGGQTIKAKEKRQEKKKEEEKETLPALGAGGKKELKKTRKVRAHAEPDRWISNRKRWPTIGSFLVLALIAFGAIGIGLHFLLQKGPGPLVTLPIKTPTLTFTNTYILTDTPTITLPPTPTPTLTPSATFTATPGIGSTWMRPADGMVMVYVPAGDFTMGSPVSSNTQPVHTIYLDAYWIDKTDVTNAMYVLCVKAGTCQPPASSNSSTRASYYGNSQYADYPVEFVNWTDANAYCNWVGAMLPTEAEWEKAARGADGRIYPWGNTSPTCSLANFNPACVGDTSEVGAYPSGASPYGALDMAGNVWQWVNDWYASYNTSSQLPNPQGPYFGKTRVLRGGYWGAYDDLIRSANRSEIVPTSAVSNVGFRCDRVAP